MTLINGRRLLSAGLAQLGLIPAQTPSHTSPISSADRRSIRA